MLDLKSLLFAGSAMFAGATSALAAAGTVGATVTPLGDGNVTYSVAADPPAPALETFAGLKVVVSNNGGNTVNNIRFSVKAFAADPAETVRLFKPDAYLPASCTWSDSDPSTFDCFVGQLQSGRSFPEFVVFYRVPVKVDGNGQADAPGSDYIGASVRIVYAEGTNDANSVPQNSIGDVSLPNLILLGTLNPVTVKSAVPNSGGKLHTGAGGVPTLDNKLTELVEVPALTAVPYTTAEINVSKVFDSEDGGCMTQGHFIQCPVYSTTIPGTFADSPWLKTIHRFDASNLKMSASKILNSTQITYSGDFEGVAYVDHPVDVCVNGQPTGIGVPCVIDKFCYKRNTPNWTPDLDGDCEFQLINTKNGLLKFQ